MRKSIVASTVAILMSSGAWAHDIHSTTAEPTGFKIKKSAKNSANTASAVQCTVSEFLALSPEEAATHIHVNGLSCITFAFGSTRIDEIFSDERVNAVIDLALSTSASYTLDSEFNDSGLFNYLRAMYFQRFYDRLTVSEQTTARVNDVIDAWLAIPNFTNLYSFKHGEMLDELVKLLDGMDNWTPRYQTVKSIMSNMTAQQRDTFEYQKTLSSATAFLFRGQVNDVEGFGKNVLGQDTEIAGILADLALDPLLTQSSDSSGVTAANNMTNQLGNLLELPDITESVSQAVQRVLDGNERLSTRWMNLVTAIDRYDTVSCEDFSGNVCATDELRAEIEELVFPNTFTVDGGKMVFRTALSREEVEQLTYQLQEVRANFFRVTGATEPVAGDVNDVAIFKIYGSRDEYNSFQNFLYDLPSNNGGIYIERDSTLYTWDREEWESRFSLEELARHEYVHYLNSRYLIPGYWGETEMYANERQTWVDEGLANFFAGGTQYEGVHPLASMVDWVGVSDDHYSPEQVVNTTYSDSMMYPYSSLLFSYMHDTQSSFLSELFSVLRNDDVAGYDALRTLIGEQSGNDFTVYINNLANNIDDLENPWKQYPTESQLWHTDAADVEWEIETDFGDVVSNVVCDNESELQFACTMTLAADVDSQYPLFDMEPAINNMVEQFTTSVNGNLVTANCYSVDISGTEHEVKCQGGLRSDGTDYEDENTAPESQDSSVTVDENSSVTGTMIGSDANQDDVLEFVIASQPSNGSLEFDEETGDFAYTPDADFFGSDSFEFYVTDGDLESGVSTVSITVNEVEDPNTAPTVSNASYSVNENASLSRTLTGSDVDGDSLTFRIVSQPSNGTVTLNENTGAFTYTPSAAGTVTFTYVANDGEQDSNVGTVTITVQEVQTPAPTPAPTRETESSSGGGSMGMFSALGLLAIALIRRRTIVS